MSGYFMLLLVMSGYIWLSCQVRSVYVMLGHVNQRITGYDS